MNAAKRRLAVVWFGGAGLLCLLVALQSVRGVYTGETEKAWAWLLPSIMPTLSLIIGVLVSDAQYPDRPEHAVDAFFPRLATVFSAVYLATVLATILFQPIVSATPLELMNMSHLWLAPFQGLVSALMGALFVQQPEKAEPKPSEVSTEGGT
jgi:hypothetical protein